MLLVSQVRWFKDGSEIRKGKKYEIVAQGRQHILIIHKSVFDDEAEYECDAKTSKSSGMLTVVGKNQPTAITWDYLQFPLYPPAVPALKWVSF